MYFRTTSLIFIIEFLNFNLKSVKLSSHYKETAKQLSLSNAVDQSTQNFACSFCDNHVISFSSL